MLKEKHIKEKVLVVQGSKYVGNENSEILYLPKKFTSQTYTVIYGDFIRISIWSDTPYFIIIKNNDLANFHKKQFKVFWELSKPKRNK
ncbi:TPA: hypothetical protein HA371_08120 [Candidatus Woesearchaeota archaeon]|nr:hypothetical protein [Candidatus Woesearchaeota archaeon]